MPFKIKKYILPDSSSDLVTWYESLDVKGKAAFVARVEFISKCRNAAELTAQYCKPIDDGISEVRFKSRKVQQRPLGYFGPVKQDYTFLFPAEERGGEFVPKDAIERAKVRRHEIKTNPGRSNDWELRVIE